MASERLGAWSRFRDWLIVICVGWVIGGAIGIVDRWLGVPWYLHVIVGLVNGFAIVNGATVLLPPRGNPRG